MLLLLHLTKKFFLKMNQIKPISCHFASHWSTGLLHADPRSLFLLRVSLESRDLVELLVDVDHLDLPDLLDCLVPPERLAARYETRLAV